MLNPTHGGSFSEATDFWSRRSFLSAAAGTALGLGAALGASAVPAFGAPGPESAPDTETASPATNDGGRPAVSPYATPCVTDSAERDRSPKRLLIVVDYQVDFVSGGVFGEIEPARAIEHALAEKIRAYREAGDLIIYTMDSHPADTYDLTREGQFNPPHCIPGTPGWELYGEVAEVLSPETAILVRKGTYGSRDLPFIVEAIRSQGVLIDSVEFAGVSTTCRVLHNAIIMYNFFPELPMVFDERTTASYTDERTAAQLDELEAWGFIVRRA